MDNLNEVLQTPITAACEAARLGASGAADVRQVLSHRGIPLHLKDCPRETQPIRRSK